MKTNRFCCPAGDTTHALDNETPLRNRLKVVSFSLCRNIFPPNLVQAAIFQQQTELKTPVNANETDMSKWPIKTGNFVDGEFESEALKRFDFDDLKIRFRYEHHGNRCRFDRFWHRAFVGSRANSQHSGLLQWAECNDDENHRMGHLAQSHRSFLLDSVEVDGDGRHSWHVHETWPLLRDSRRWNHLPRFRHFAFDLLLHHEKKSDQVCRKHGTSNCDGIWYEQL